METFQLFAQLARAVQSLQISQIGLQIAQPEDSSLVALALLPSMSLFCLRKDYYSWKILSLFDCNMGYIRENETLENTTAKEIPLTADMCYFQRPLRVRSTLHIPLILLVFWRQLGCSSANSKYRSYLRQTKPLSTNKEALSAT